MASQKLLKVVALLLIHTQSLAQEPLKGDVSAVYDLISRVLPSGGATGTSRHFRLELVAGGCGSNFSSDGRPCFQLQDDKDGKLLITATTASELSAGVGWYLRHFCNMTIGWPRGGGSNVFLPETWPKIGPVTLTKERIKPWSYLMNVCTHSYSLVWYDWPQWQQFIDWMSLTGINLVLAMTGQEEVQYKVFSKLGVQDKDIRSWFNGPAFLAWSRGQNEYGSGICGPLPRSWMKDQWEMQRDRILPRLRSLGITGQLPGFQGNVPVQLKALLNDSNITEDGDTGWMDSLDPLFGRIADLWMQTLIEDFGTDHWYQLDGYFDGSTAPWENYRTERRELHRPIQKQKLVNMPRDDLAFRRGVAAYTGLNRTDPDAVWSFQGWAIVGWSTTEQASILKGFVDSVPNSKLVIIDMQWNGDGEWKQWENSSFFGAPFVWTTLNNFGATSGMKGDLSMVNRIPFEGPASSIGTGATPEGIDQNPAYYEFVFEQNFHDEPVQNMHSHMVQRSHRRYGLVEHNSKIGEAWSLLVDSAYAEDRSTQDTTGVTHLNLRGGDSDSLFELDRHTPKPVLCKMVRAWKLLIEAAEDDSEFSGFKKEPFTYDLVNLGREVLAQIATPTVLNFTNATSKEILVKDEIWSTGSVYIQLLNDIDTLVATDEAFLLGPWIESARHLGKSQNDCYSTFLEDSNCEHFYEWNARCQITTWNPTSKDGPIDYASKHWSGLIRDYYVPRAALLMEQALRDQAFGCMLNQTKLAQIHATLAHSWSTSKAKYSTSPIGDAIVASRRMYDKYGRWFASCEKSKDEAVHLAVQNTAFLTNE